MNALTLPPLRRIDGEVTLPGSKSLSNRILLLAAVASGETRISNLLDSDDVRHMLKALGALGVPLQISADKTQCTVTGQAGALGHADALTLFLGNAGTAMRPLCAMLCAGQGEFTLTGEPRMYERPIGDLVDCLRAAGAQHRLPGHRRLPAIAAARPRALRGPRQHQGQYLQPVSDRHADGSALLRQ
jgi:3-phosphoshikimate 1-carboxyvinyltransferase